MTKEILFKLYPEHADKIEALKNVSQDNLVKVFSAIAKDSSNSDIFEDIDDALKTYSKDNALAGLEFKDYQKEIKNNPFAKNITQCKDILNFVISERTRQEFASKKSMSKEKVDDLMTLTKHNNKFVRQVAESNVKKAHQQALSTSKEQVKTHEKAAKAPKKEAKTKSTEMEKGLANIKKTLGSIKTPKKQRLSQANKEKRKSIGYDFSFDDELIEEMLKEDQSSKKTKNKKTDVKKKHNIKPTKSPKNKGKDDGGRSIH